MGKDYYAILSIPRTSTSTEIRKAYHHKALELHPDKNPLCGALFKDVLEAYDVLSSCKKKALYDELGEEELKKRMDCQFPAKGSKTMFKEMFMREFSHYLDSHTNSTKSRVYPEKCTRHVPFMNQKDKSVVRDLNISLEELYTGFTKRIKITKKVKSTVNPNKYKLEEKMLEIKVRPGWKDGTRITFEREGNVSGEAIPADIIFVVREKPHQHFKREGDDLVQTVEISLKHSLIGTQLTLPTIDKNVTLDVRLEHIISPGYTKIYPNKGMRSQKDYNKRGQLILKFTINFPEFLNTEQRDLISRVLPDD